MPQLTSVKSCLTLALLVLALGCTAPGARDPSPSDPLPSGGDRASSSGGGDVPGDLGRPELGRMARLLEPRVARRPTRRPLTRVFRSGDAVLMVEWEQRPRPRTLFAIMDLQWRPRAAAIELRNVSLNPVRNIAGGWLVLAEQVAGDNSVLREAYAVLRADGSLAVLPEGSPGAPTRPGDVLFLDSDYRLWAFRPSSDSVWQASRPDWATPGPMHYLTQEEPFCTGPYHTSQRMQTRCTSDHGRTWHELMLADVLPDSLPTLNPVKHLRRGRLVLGLGRTEMLEKICVLELVSRAPGARFRGCSRPPEVIDHFRVLPDGSAVFAGTRGVYVATSPANRRFIRRPAPLETRPGALYVMEEDLVALYETGSTRGLWVSQDLGSTWRRVSALEGRP